MNPAVIDKVTLVVYGVLKEYPEVSLYTPDGEGVAYWADSFDYVVRLTNAKNNYRGVWLDHKAVKENNLDQFLIDLHEACAKLTELTKETDNE